MIGDLTLLALSQDVRRGAKSGGCRIVQHDSALRFPSSQSSCGQSGLSNCSEAVVAASADTTVRVFHVLAAFSNTSSPQMSVISFGVSWDPNRFVLYGSGTCADFELAGSGWPNPGADTARIGRLRRHPN